MAVAPALQMADKAAAKRAEVQEARRLAAEADAVIAAVKSEKASARASHKQAAQQRLAGLKKAVSCRRST
jgi:putative NADH-flavin reductase